MTIINKLEIFPYTLPLKRTWTSAGGEFSERKGFIVKVYNETGTGYGDCAPLLQAGTESYQLAHDFLLEAATKCRNINSETVLEQLNSEMVCPAAVCGIETAILDLIAKLHNKSVAQYLNPAALECVNINNNLGVLDRQHKINQDSKFSVVKLKVGIVDSQEELHYLRTLSQRLEPGVLLRLDANGAWSYDDAEKFIEACGDLPVESIEEPLQQPSVVQLKQLQSNTEISLAIDESLKQIGHDVLLDEQPVKRLIVKPMREGGLRTSLSLIHDSLAAGFETIVTTTVDSAVGVWAATHLAAAIGSAGTGFVHGLATSGWLAEDIAIAPEIINARICLGNITGLGAEEIYI